MSGDLYLLGGQAAFASVVDEFVRAAGGSEARIALLLLGGNPRSQRQVAQYRDPLLAQGASSVLPVMPDEQGGLDLAAALESLSEATAIYIGGGYTPTYLELYASEPIRQTLQRRSADGVPVGGVCAGALIMPQVCAIPPQDTGSDTVTLADGLGLIQQVVIGVHFSEWQALPYVLVAMAQTHTSWALGLDEGGAAILRDGELVSTLGSGIHAIEMMNFETRDYAVVRVA